MVTLNSGCHVAVPIDRLRRFCIEEYNYYDEVTYSDPTRIEPIDIVITISVNSFINSAKLVRSIHRGMAECCDGILAEIPEDANILSFDPAFERVRTLLDAAVQVPAVGISRATKILHRKRRKLIPMLDNVVLTYYRKVFSLSAPTDKKSEARTAIEVLEHFRDDLHIALAEMSNLQTLLQAEGFNLSLVRILEILIWTEYEPQGYYRV